MKKVKSLFVFLLCIIMSFEATLICVSAEETTEQFAGTRTIVFSGDKSDIENFIDGGRATFDIITRSAVPEWLTCSILSDNTAMLLTMEFSFASYEEYTSKLYELLTYYPAIYYSTENGLTLLESHDSTDLLNSIQSFFNAKNCINEKNMNEIFSVKENRIILDGKEYSFEKSIAIRPEKIKLEKLKLLSVKTSSKDDGSYRRTITATVDSTRKSAIDNVKELLGNGGKIKESKDSEETTTLSVSFDAVNQTELVKTTMLCLGISTSITEKQSFKSDDTVSVERREFFDTEAILEENGEFEYTFSFSDEIDFLTADEEKYSISGSTLKASNVSMIICSYDRGIKFSKAEMITDLSGFSGKIKRTVKFSMPTDIAQLYHEKIKKSVEKNLIKGTEFNIYDSGALRFYELNFSAFFNKDITEFSNEVLKSKGAFTYKDSWFPFGTSTLNETVSFAKTISDFVPADETVITYILPKTALKVMKDKDDKTYSLQENILSFTSSYEKTVSIEFRELDILKTIIEAVPTLVIIVIIITFISKLNKKKKSDTQ